MNYKLIALEDNIANLEVRMERHTGWQEIDLQQIIKLEETHN